MRHLFDRGRFGLVLIGMPGIERRLSRFVQLYSRVGFVHHYRPLPAAELREILLHHLGELIESSAGIDLSDPEILAQVRRIGGGNLRLVVRLLMQIDRILAINQRSRVTADIVDAARDVLVIGTD